MRPTSRDALGWYDEHAIYVPTERMAEAIGRVMGTLSFVRWLDRKDLLLRRGNSDRLAIRNVPGIGKVDSYALDRAEFHDV